MEPRGTYNLLTKSQGPPCITGRGDVMGTLRRGINAHNDLKKYSPLPPLPPTPLRVPMTVVGSSSDPGAYAALESLAATGHTAEMV